MEAVEGTFPGAGRFESEARELFGRGQHSGITPVALRKARGAKSLHLPRDRPFPRPCRDRFRVSPASLRVVSPNRFSESPRNDSRPAGASVPVAFTRL